MEELKGIKGYKVFKSDFSCKCFQFEVGKSYKIEGDLKICSNGFHFCEKASDCFNYYDFDSKNKVAEILATGKIVKENDKSVASEILIVREIEWQELLTIVNTGKNCTGLNNSGNRNSGNRNSGCGNSGNRNSGCGNSGNRNSGCGNSGNRNSGDFNSGDGNSGNCNSGYGNSGNRNFGNRNSGNCNSGYGNSGDFNSGNCNNGFFSTKTPKLTIFEKETDMTYDQIQNLKGICVIRKNFELTRWIDEEKMTDSEKEDNPNFETLGGFLKKFSYKEAWSNMWNKLSDSDKQSIKDLPNFDSAIFFEITGIQV